MNVYEQLLIGLIGFLGLGCGIVLAYIAKEEIKQGKTYLNLLQYYIVVLMVVLVMYQSSIHVVAIVVLSLLLFILLLKLNIPSYFYFLGLTVILWYLSKFYYLFIISGVLLFIYGFPTGSLLVYDKKKWYQYLPLYILSMILYVILIFL
jgi:hypothetical protein